MKPLAFRWSDFLTFGVIGLLALSAAVWVDLRPDVTAYQKLTMTVVGTLFLGPYALAVYWRSRFLDAFTWIGDGWRVFVDRDRLQSPVNEYLACMEQMVSAYRVPGVDVRTYVGRDDVWVRMRQPPVTTNTGRKVAGYAVAGGNDAVVAYERPESILSKTAFCHEVGHVVLGRYFTQLGHPDPWSEKVHHEFMAANRLP